MEWTDDAIVLGVRRLGETSAVASILTREHGRHGGLVRGGATPGGRAVLAMGNRVRARWRGRLDAHLGTLVCEPEDAVAARLITDRVRLAALVAACAILDASLPEREPQPEAYADLQSLLDALLLAGPWPKAYVRWELAVLAVLGFGLDLGRCAATGRNDDLAYVSPKSGRAVSLAAGEPYRDRLLPLPAFLILPDRQAGVDDIAQGLHLTGYFLDRHAFPSPAELPPARQRLVDLMTGSGPRSPNRGPAAGGGR